MPKGRKDSVLKTVTCKKLVIFVKLIVKRQGLCKKVRLLTTTEY